MNTVVKWFKDKFPQSTHKLTVAEQNRKLLYESLGLCYNRKQIQIVKDVLNHSLDSFEVNQGISFTLELLKRERMIEYCYKKLHRQYYLVNEVQQLLENTSKRYQCDAILLHIERYKEIYTENGDNLSVYFRMVKERKAYLCNEIE